MSMEYKGAGAVEDPEVDVLYVEIDDVLSTGRFDIPAPAKLDKFAAIPIEKLDSRSKRKATRLNKRLQATDGSAGSKYIDEEFISGYALYDVAHPPYDFDQLANIYEESAIHNAAVNAKALNAVGLGYTWEHTRKTKKRLEKVSQDEAKTKTLIEELAKEVEKMDDLFESFSEEEMFTETLIKAATDMYSLGSGFIEVGRKANGEIGYVGHVPATNLRVRRPRDGFVQMVNQSMKKQVVFFRNFGDRETVDPFNNDPNPNEIIHLKIYSPINQFYGVPHIISALPAVVGDKFAKEYNIDYFENKAIPRYAIIIKGAKLSEQAKKEVIQYFRNEVKGKNHGTLIIPLPATMGGNVDVKFEKLEVGVQDGSFEKYRKSNRDEIISAHRVPPTKVGVYENANLAVSRDADKTFKEQVIGPDQQRIEKRVNNIVKEFTDALKFKFVQLDIIDADMKSRIHDRYARLEAITPNEIRSDIGLPAKEGGNDVLPYVTKVQDKKIDIESEHRDKDRKENAKARTLASTSGGQPGNTSNPPKTGPNTPKDQTGTRDERGQTQDTQGVRERNDR